MNVSLKDWSEVCGAALFAVLPGLALLLALAISEPAPDATESQAASSEQEGQP